MALKIESSRHFGESNHSSRAVLQFITWRSRGEWREVKEATVTLPGVSLKLQKLQPASGGEEVWQEGDQVVALQK